MKTTTDIDGNVIEQGSIVRVLSIRPSVIARLSQGELKDVLSMKDAELEVYEVDEYGAAWVRKWWDEGEGKTYSHSLALTSAEMRLVGRP